MFDQEVSVTVQYLIIVCLTSVITFFHIKKKTMAFV